MVADRSRSLHPVRQVNHDLFPYHAAVYVAQIMRLIHTPRGPPGNLHRYSLNHRDVAQYLGSTNDNPRVSVLFPVAGQYADIVRPELLAEFLVF